MAHTTRRTIIAGLALAPLAAPAALAGSPSQIMPLFRQWLAFQHGDYHHLTGGEADAEVDKMMAIECRLADEPATTAEELAAKLIATTEYGCFGLDGETGEKLLTEACGLAGVSVPPFAVAS